MYCTCTVYSSIPINMYCITLSFSPHHQVKHLQFVSGVSASSYWLSTFIFDLLNALIPIILTFVLFAVFQIEGYTGENLAALLLLLVCVNINCTCTLTHILTMYMYVYMYNVYSTCYIDTDTCMYMYTYTLCSFCCLFILQLLTNWATIPITYCFSFLFSNALLAFSLMFIVFYFVSLVKNISTCTCTVLYYGIIMNYLATVLLRSCTCTVHDTVICFIFVNEEISYRPCVRKLFRPKIYN